MFTDTVLLNAVDRLYALKDVIYEDNEKGYEARVEFLSIVYRYGLKTDLTEYRIWDYGYEGLGERQYDTCFEMCDAERVIKGLLVKAEKEGFLSSIPKHVLEAVPRQLSLEF